MELKRAKVVMLPTEDKALLYTFKGGDGTIYEYTEYANKVIEDQINQHLYFTTDENIKEGDWITNGKKIYHNKVQLDGYIGLYKIIASTDPKIRLNIPTLNTKGERTVYPAQFPKPSQAFIEKYCKLGGIDEVDVELEYIKGDELGADPAYFKWPKKLKANSHNEITIREIKNSWSRNEVIALFNKAHNDRAIAQRITYNNWIKENL